MSTAGRSRSRCGTCAKCAVRLGRAGCCMCRAGQKANGTALPLRLLLRGPRGRRGRCWSTRPRWARTRTPCCASASRPGLGLASTRHNRCLPAPRPIHVAAARRTRRGGRVVLERGGLLQSWPTSRFRSFPLEPSDRVCALWPDERACPGGSLVGGAVAAWRRRRPRRMNGRQARCHTPFNFLEGCWPGRSRLWAVNACRPAESCGQRLGGRCLWVGCWSIPMACPRCRPPCSGTPSACPRTTVALERRSLPWACCRARRPGWACRASSMSSAPGCPLAPTC